MMQLVGTIKANVGAFYRISEALALLDMCVSFADTSSLHNCVRPEFSDTLAIKSGRHPVLDAAADGFVGVLYHLY